MKRLGSILTLVIFLVVVGCSDENEATSEVKEENGTVQTTQSSEATVLEPPEFTITAGEKTIHPTLGTHSWTIDNGDGTAESIEVDSDAPPDLVTGKNTLQLTADSSVELNFEEPPTNYILRIWDEEYTIGRQTKEVDLTGTGIVIYEVLAHWEQGTASYAFAVEVIAEP
ncbi:hypothetical protein LG275_08065 [Chryseomicrobium palamuruense]